MGERPYPLLSTTATNNKQLYYYVRVLFPTSKFLNIFFLYFRTCLSIKKKYYSLVSKGQYIIYTIFHFKNKH